MCEAVTDTTSSGVPQAIKSPPVFSAFWSQVNDPVGGFDYVQVVLDYDRGVARVDESVEYVE